MESGRCFLIAPPYRSKVRSHVISCDQDDFHSRRDAEWSWEWLSTEWHPSLGFGTDVLTTSYHLLLSDTLSNISLNTHFSDVNSLTLYFGIFVLYIYIEYIYFMLYYIVDITSIIVIIMVDINISIIVTIVDLC